MCEEGKSYTQILLLFTGNKAVHPAQLQPCEVVGLYRFLSRGVSIALQVESDPRSLCMEHSSHLEGIKPYVFCATAGELPFDLLGLCLGL